jgi:DNA topoisomerase-1
MEGPYGPYVTDGKTNASVPKGSDPAAITLAEAEHLIEERKARGPARKTGRKKTTGKRTAKKKAAKKKTAKKKTVRKKSST